MIGNWIAGLDEYALSESGEQYWYHLVRPVRRCGVYVVVNVEPPEVGFLNWELG